MTNFDIKATHESALEHHVLQGAAWLLASDSGAKTAAVSYAALEFRFAIERLAVHYWRQLLDRTLTQNELEMLGSFKAVEKQIYDLAGHQLEINRHFDFMRIVLSALSIPTPLHTPNIGLLSRHWHLCSELCHVSWPLASKVEGLRIKMYTHLCEVSEALKKNTESLGWPLIKDETFNTIRAEYVAGRIDSPAVTDHLNRIGIWAEYQAPGESNARILGTPVPPNSTSIGTTTGEV